LGRKSLSVLGGGGKISQQDRKGVSVRVGSRSLAKEVNLKDFLELPIEGRGKNSRLGRATGHFLHPRTHHKWGKESENKMTPPKREKMET